MSGAELCRDKRIVWLENPEGGVDFVIVLAELQHVGAVGKSVNLLYRGATKAVAIDTISASQARMIVQVCRDGLIVPKPKGGAS